MALLLVAGLLFSLAGCRLPPWQEKDAGRPLNELERRAARLRGGDQILLPDLRPRSAHGRVFGETVSIAVKVRNQGRDSAGTFEVVAQVVGARQTARFTRTVPSLPAGADWEEEMGTLIVPLASRPEVYEVQVTVDPVSPAQRRGRQIEEDEANNERTFTVTIY